ncbi:protein of unknown function (plasmid) [Cupriavidus taiwanensis]|nr:protein of unknown function [Cupriavidus taiwanensis]SOZ72044.1 protein of unknown function [Cupriavidus taiwanensis]SOZ74373.1 protein of unknown function [Cupriavidus taiwanensis]
MLQLEAARRLERYDSVLRHNILGPRLLIVDEIGYLPFVRGPDQPLLSDRCQTIWAGASPATSRSPNGIRPSATQHWPLRCWTESSTRGDSYRAETATQSRPRVSHQRLIDWFTYNLRGRSKWLRLGLRLTRVSEISNGVTNCSHASGVHIIDLHHRLNERSQLSRSTRSSRSAVSARRLKTVCDSRDVLISIRTRPVPILEAGCIVSQGNMISSKRVLPAKTLGKPISAPHGTQTSRAHMQRPW